MRMTDAEQAATEELIGWLRDRFGARLQECIIFGSRARGEGDEASDLDLAVVVEGLSTSEGRAIAEHCGDLLTRHGVLVSTFSLSAERAAFLRARERLIMADIARDGVAMI